jgi:hypothetical protein
LVSIIRASEFLNELNSYLYPKNSFMEITKRERNALHLSTFNTLFLKT